MSGAYIIPEWTAYADIGKQFNGEALSDSAYKTVENAYIAAIFAYMRCQGQDALQVCSLEKPAHVIIPSDLLGMQKKSPVFLSEGCWIDRSQIEWVARLILREIIWCKLEAHGMYVHFGNDFYMYIGVQGLCEGANQAVQSSGLFIEAHSSPYV